MFNTNRKTKIIATLGPATFDPKMLKNLIEAGVNLFRLNFSHSDYSLAEVAIKNIRQLANETRKSIGIFIDLQGPKIRVGKFQNGKIKLENGQKFTLTIENILGDEQKVSTTYLPLVNDAQVGNKILLDDGKIILEVVDKDEKNVITKVLVGGELSDRKGMNLPGMKLSTAALTEKDKKDVEFGIAQRVDYFALSFVRSASDVLELQEILKKHKADIKVIAKIEKPEALEHLPFIVKSADAIMVARGDLGVEVSVEKVPQMQKDIIRKSNFGGVPVIVATQMLESMIHSPIPTRAEVSDVATAIYDWADAVMLSGETAVGEYPIQTVKMMAQVVSEVDVAQSERKRNLKIRKTHFIEEHSVLSSLCDSADELADELGAKALITFTDSGRTSLLLSKYRSSVPIIAISADQRVCDKMSLYRGVWPILSSRPFKEMKGIKDMLEEAETRVLELGLVKKGDLVVLMAGIPIATAGSTNMVRIHRVGDPF